MTSYRLRVELSLQPTTPPLVGTALGALGGDVVSVDLREVDGDHAIDEIVVDFERDPGAPTLSRALAHDPATLLSSQRCRLDEPTTQAKQWAATTDIGRADERDLTRRLSAACPFSKVSVHAAGEARSLPVVQMALARRGPVAHRCDGLPDAAGTASGASAWVLAVADRYWDPESVALLSRPLSLRFTATEAARVEVLMANTR